MPYRVLVIDDETAIREAIRMAKSGLYDKVWMNRSYSTTTGTRTAPRRLPDVIGRRKTGEYDAIEVPSKSNSPLELYIRNREALDQLPRAQRGRIRIKTILKSQKNDQ